MGLINDADNPTFNRLSAGLQDQPDPSVERPSSAALWGAAFRTENVVSSIMSREPGLLDNEIDDEFNPITDENLAGYENYSDRFYNVFNERQNAALKRQIDREQSDRDIIARSGIAGFGAAMAAGTLDPTVLIPVGGTIKKGDSLLRVGRNMAYAGAAGAMVSEIALHASQETRTAEETGFAIAGGAVLGGILGTGAVAGFRGATGKPITGFDPDELAKFEREMVADPDGDLNAPDEVLLGQIEQDIAGMGIYSPEVVRTQAAAMEAMVSTLARRTGQDPSEFYAANGPALRGDDRVRAQGSEGESRVDMTARHKVELETLEEEFTDISELEALDRAAEAKSAARRQGREDVAETTPEEASAASKLSARKEELAARRIELLQRQLEEKRKLREKQANQVLEQASAAGYKGQDTGEAAEWVAAKNKGLDMSQEARMARAAEMGFDTETVLYHGTDSVNFDAVDISKTIDDAFSLSVSPKDASNYATGDGYGHRHGSGASRVMPVFIRGRIKKIDWSKLSEGWDRWDEGIADRARKSARNEGYAGVQFDNVVDSGGNAPQVQVFDPSNIRSVNAAFDPEMSGSANLLHQNPPRSLFAAMKMDPQERSEWYDRIIDESRVGNNTVLTIKADTQNMIFDDVVIVIENGIDVEFTVKGQHADRGRNAPPENIAKGARVMAQATAALQEWMLRNDSPFVGFTGATEAHNRLYESMLGRFAFDGYLGYKTEEYRQYVNVASDGSKQADGDAYVAGFGFMIVKDGYLEQAKHFLKSREDGLNVAPRPAGGGVVKNLGTTVPIERRSRRVGSPDQGGDGDRGRSGASGDGRAFSGSDVSLTPIEPAQRELFQGQRGQFDVDTNTITLFDNADPSTLMHEASHWYLDRLFKMRGNEFVDKQLGEILDWHGTKADEVFDDAGNLTSRGVELQEAFAETFESYLQTGKAPVPRLQAVFDQFRDWLTALYKTLDPRERSNLTPEIKDVFDRMLAFEPDGMEKLNLEAMRNPQSVGAAAMAEPTLDDYELANSLGSADVSAAMRLNPLLRMATADSAVTREIGAQLMENGMYLKRNLDGMASPVSVEQAMTEYRGWHAKSETAAREAYKAARKDKSTPTMGETEFYERVALAMRRGDQDANPHVVKAAKAYREALDKVKDRAIAEGLLPEDVKVTTADSYLHRMWDRNILARRSTEFKQMTRAWLGDTFESMMARANQLRFELEKMGAKPNDADKAFLEQVDELEEILGTEGNLNDFAKTIADDVFDALMGHDTRLVDTGFTLVPNARGPLKERTFNIPDLFEAGGVKVEDFLVNDAQEVMSRYMRVMAADIELTRAFGSPDLAEPIARIREDYRKMSDAATTAKERKRLNDQMRNRIDDLNGVRDVIRGNYGENRVSGSGAVWARGAELVRAWNFMTMLGGMTVSALPDVGNKVMANGFIGITRDMIGPLMTDIKGVKGAAKEAKELGIAVEMALATRIASIADVGDMYGRGTKFERFVHNLSNRFSNWTLMRHWNDVMKTGDYIAATNRAIRVMERPGRANKKAKAWLAQLGVGEADYQRIMAQIKEHGDKRHTMRLANVEKWTDEEAKRVWIAAMGKNANIQTVTPGAGDKLLVMNGDLGKTLGQFKSFAMAANQRVMIRGAQQARMGDARFLSGMMTFISLGMLVYALKSYFSNRDTTDDPVTWVREGIDRSGTLPIFMEAFNTAEKVTGQSIIGDSPASRFASRGRVDSLAGPTFGRMQNVSDVLANAFDGELKDRDLHSVRKIMPFNNVFWLRKLFDEFEIQAVDALDAEETTLSERRESMFAD
jgi:hypothetical protein